MKDVDDQAFLFPFNGILGGFPISDEGFQNEYGIWKVLRQSHVTGEEYGNAVLGTKRELKFTSTTTATEFIALDFFSAARETFHLVFLRRGIKNYAAEPLQELVQAPAGKFPSLDTIIKGLQAGNQFADLLTKGCGATLFVAEAISRGRRMISVLATFLGEAGETEIAQLNGEEISNNPAFISLRRIEALSEISPILALFADEDVSMEIRKILTNRVAKFNIALDDISISGLIFEKEFTAEMEAKQVAAQEAEMAKFVAEKAEQDKQSSIIRRQGEAKSAQLIGEVMSNNPAFISLRRIEASREISPILALFADEVSP